MSEFEHPLEVGTYGFVFDKDFGLVRWGKIEKIFLRTDDGKVYWVPKMGRVKFENFFRTFEEARFAGFFKIMECLRWDSALDLARSSLYGRVRRCYEKWWALYRQPNSEELGSGCVGCGNPTGAQKKIRNPYKCQTIHPVLLGATGYVFMEKEGLIGVGVVSELGLNLVGEYGGRYEIEGGSWCRESDFFPTMEGARRAALYRLIEDFINIESRLRDIPLSVALSTWREKMEQISSQEEPIPYHYRPVYKAPKSCVCSEKEEE